MNARMFYMQLYGVTVRPLRRVALARMFKEAGLRSPRTQLTKVQIEISVRGRHKEASRVVVTLLACGTRGPDSIPSLAT